MKPNKESISLFLSAIIIAGLSVIVAVFIGYWMITTKPKDSGYLNAMPSSESTSSESNKNLQEKTNARVIKSYQSSLGYSFNFAFELVGGKQTISNELKKAGIEESVVFQTPKDAQDHFVILTSVEQHQDITQGLHGFADSYEEGSRTAGMILTRLGEKKLTIDGVEILERSYTIQGRNNAKNIVRFMLKGTRLYVISLLRSSDSDALKSMEKFTLDSLHFYSE